jgi:carbonic anhydrase
VFKKVSVFLVAMVLLMSTAFANSAEVSVNADKAMQFLVEGNQRFMTEQHANVHNGQARRDELTKGQHPFAIVVSCSDSRVPPELVFDEGLGELFVVRTAGEVVDDVAMGSIEYAIEHLGVKLVVVLGHEECGAVKATIAGGEVPGHILAIAKAITPAVNQAKLQKGDLLTNSIRANIDLIVDKLKTSEPIIKETIAKDHVKIVGAVYELKTGKVVFH